MTNSILAAEIEKASRSVSTDSFDMTLGEVVNLYRDGDLVINPDFQRFFRWDIGRKSRLIESLLVRIPLPPIFVFELENSRYEVIDGLQRLSTILEFMGELKDPETNLPRQPMPLVGTQYLEALSGAFWSEDLLKAYQSTREVDGEIDFKPYFFDSDLQRSIKRTKIGLQVLEKKSDHKSKYDLFQRLNSGGLSANAQELRNCTVIMSSPEFYARMQALTRNQDFIDMIPMEEASRLKSNDYEQISRIISFGFIDYTPGTDIEDFVNKSLVSIAVDETSERQAEIEAKVVNTFSLIRGAIGKDGLRPFDGEEFRGRIGRTSIEIIFLGVLYNLEKISSLGDPEGFVVEKAKMFWMSGEATTFTAAGVSGTDRVARTIPYGRKMFDPEG
ncbi:DUF262 domain-containing protein [Limimaricola hongkongensis]|uniref:DUF262 domain-containing protein n=1 Tax=Limimaricola hongkongensis TaxID=278132 RepID=UPI0009DA2C07|nr:DUF262 domain-containing protein [Limimaricola hongkongensis]